MNEALGIVCKVTTLGKRRNKTWHRRLSSGLCGECGKQPFLAGKQHCSDCSAKRSATYRRRRANALATNTCVRSGCQKPVFRNALCVECNQAQCDEIRRYRQQRLAYGGCEHCGVDVGGAKKVCDSCHCKKLAQQHCGDRKLYQALLGIFEKQGGRCAYTGVRLIIGYDASIDHIVPKGKGGSLMPENLQWVHTFVNVFRRHEDEEPFMRRLETFMSAASGNLWECSKRHAIKYAFRVEQEAPETWSEVNMKPPCQKRRGR